MRFVDNYGTTDARRNLALEEHLLRHGPADEDLLLFYVNAPAVIVGRNQNTVEEVDPAVVAARGVTVVRRLSGGGAVYHDAGNLNFSVHTAHAAERFNRYEAFVGPVVDVLRSLGIPAELGGRNDVTVEGRKVSGNAQFTTTRRMFSHGTLLVDADLDAVSAVLRPRPGKVESKGVKSVRARVANLAEFAPGLTVGRLRGLILERLFGSADPARAPAHPLGDADWAAVDALVASRYGSDAWTYGEDPPSDVARSARTAAGELDVRLGVRGGRITAARVYGDFQGPRDVAELERRLVGAAYTREGVEAALAGADVRDYFGAVTREEVVAVVAG